MILFGSSLFRFYAVSGLARSSALLSRSADVALASICLVAAGAWLLAFTSALAGPEDWAETLKALLFETSLGVLWGVRLLGAVLLVGAALLKSKALIAALGAVLLGCEGWSGHAASWGPAGSVTMAVHVIGAGAWIGGLVPLSRFVRAAKPYDNGTVEAQAVLLRFSHLGVVAVCAITATGGANTSRMLGTALPDPMSTYGRVLLAKIALFGLMLVLAALNRYWLTPRLAQQGTLLCVLVRTIALEQALAASRAPCRQRTRADEPVHVICGSASQPANLPRRGILRALAGQKLELV